MDQSEHDAFIVGPDDPVLVTGATGFIGSRLVESLLDRGCRNIRLFADGPGRGGPSSVCETTRRCARVAIRDSGVWCLHDVAS